MSSGQPDAAIEEGRRAAGGANADSSDSVASAESRRLQRNEKVQSRPNWLYSRRAVSLVRPAALGTLRWTTRPLAALFRNENRGADGSYPQANP